jgi:hypothetical protein
VPPHLPVRSIDAMVLGNSFRLDRVSRRTATEGRRFSSSVNGWRWACTVATTATERSNSAITASRNATEASSILPSSSTHDEIRVGVHCWDRKALEVLEGDTVAAHPGAADADVREHAAPAVERLEHEADALTALA